MVIDLDPSAAERRKEARRQRLNMVRIPTLRLVGFCFVSLFVFLYNYFVVERVEWKTFAVLTAGFLGYCAASWAALPDAKLLGMAAQR